MKVSKEQSADNRRRIVDAAARLYREQGFRGVGVAEITKAAGLTHGGLYRHFDSKESLAAQACLRAFDWNLAQFSGTEFSAPPTPAQLAAAYLTPAHRENPGGGCPVAALATDCAREGGLAAQAFTQGFAKYLEALTSHAASNEGRRRPTRQDRQAALLQVIQLVGSMVLARATSASDPDISAQILAVGQAAVSGRPTGKP